jgi:hypothetical protein
MFMTQAGIVHPTPASRLHRLTAMFAFFSNRLGCVGSLAVSILLSLVMITLMRACSAGPGTGF